MFKYAEVVYGKVVAIYEDERDLKSWKKLFDSDTLWVDVTGQKVEVGWVFMYDPKTGWILRPDTEDKPSSEKGIINTMTDKLLMLEGKVSELTTDNEILNDTMLEVVDLLEGE